jgi:hypothetical protein
MGVDASALTGFDIAELDKLVVGNESEADIDGGPAKELTLYLS